LNFINPPLHWWQHDIRSTAEHLRGSAGRTRSVGAEKRSTGAERREPSQGATRPRNPIGAPSSSSHEWNQQWWTSSDWSGAWNEGWRTQESWKTSRPRHHSPERESKTIEAFERYLDTHGWTPKEESSPTQPPPHFERYTSEAAGPKSPNHPPPTHLVETQRLHPPARTAESEIQPPPPKPVRTITATTAKSAQENFALYKQLVAEAKAKAPTAQQRVKSVTDLRRSWSRSKLNPTPSHPRDVEVKVFPEEEFDSPPNWDPPTPPTIQVSPTSPSPVSPAIAAPPTPPFRVTTVPPPPRLRVALDYHLVIQIDEWQQGVKYEVIPQAHIDAIARLAQHHEVYVFSWAPSRETSANVEASLHRSGILDIIGGSRHLYTGRQIPAKVSFTDRFGEFKRGKALIAKDLGIHVIVDDSTDITDEARRIGLNAIGINARRNLNRLDIHHFGVKDLVVAVDLILEDPSRWF
jgi:hypothetical protein